MSPESVAPAKPGINPFWWLLFIFALNLALPFLPVPNLVAAIVSNVALTLIYVGAVVLFALGVARREWKLSVVLIGLTLSALAWLAVEKLGVPVVNNFVQTVRQSGAQPSALQMFAVNYASALQDMALMSGAIFLGNLISRFIRAPNMLGPIGAVIALIDIWGVLFGGIVSQLLTNKATQGIAERAMTTGPQIGAVGAARPEFSIPLPQIGVGDFLFLSLLLGIIVIHRMNWRASARWMWALVSVALLSIVFVPALVRAFPIPVVSNALKDGFPLPGLVPIGLGAVLPNWKFFTYTRDEKFALLYAGGFVLILTVALYLGFKAALPSR